MDPRLSVQNMADVRFANAKFVSHSCHRHIADSVSISDGQDLLTGQLRPAITLPPAKFLSSTTFRFAIGHIIQLRTKKEMVRPNACPIVASVKDAKIPNLPAIQIV